MNNRLEQAIYRTIDFNLPLILCVSGGKDSVCLFHAVMKFKEKFKSAPEVIHFNHGLRKASNKEAEFVRTLCGRFNVPIRVFKLNVKEVASQNGFSIEEAARVLRYRKLDEHTINMSSSGYIFTAHTASDQLETVLFRLIKGTGRGGLRGIRRELLLPGGWTVKRPFLDFTMEEVKGYITVNKIKYCTDKSNSDLSFPRNFIRHKIVKYLKKLNSSVEKTITKESEILAEEENFLKQKMEEELLKIKIKKTKDRIHIELNKILSYNIWLQRRVLRELSPVELDYNRINSLVKLIYAEGTTTYIELGQGWKARKDYGKLIFERKISPALCFEYRLVLEEEVNIEEAGKKIKANIIKNKVNEIPTGNAVVFDADKVNLNNIRFRSRRAGDRMSLWGLGGTKKIKDLCIDLKLSLEEKNNLVLVEEDNKILWAAPYRRSDIAPVNEKTNQVLKLKIEDE